MKKIKVGYLPLYLKLYDDYYPAMRKPMEEYMNTLVEKLEEHGLEEVAGMCRAAVARDAFKNIMHCQPCTDERRV